MEIEIGTPIVVTTKHRGVFFGYFEELIDRPEEKTVTLTQSRMVVYWPSSVRGVVGLAVDGPNEESRVTKAAPKLTAYGVTAVLTATSEAAKQFELEPWK